MTFSSNRNDNQDSNNAGREMLSVSKSGNEKNSNEGWNCLVFSDVWVGVVVLSSPRLIYKSNSKKPGSIPPGALSLARHKLLDRELSMLVIKI